MSESQKQKLIGWAAGVAIVVSIITMLGLVAQVGADRQRLDDTVQRVHSHDQAINRIHQSLTRMETQIEHQTKTLDEIKSAVQRRN